MLGEGDEGVPTEVLAVLVLNRVAVSTKDSEGFLTIKLTVVGLDDYGTIPNFDMKPTARQDGLLKMRGDLVLSGDGINLSEDLERMRAFPFDGVRVDVLSQGIPPDLFDCGVPVVLEGKWVRGQVPAGVEWPAGADDGWWFETDRILVKHDNDYREDRIVDAAERGNYDAEQAAELCGA